MTETDDPTALKALYPVAMYRLMRSNGLLLIAACTVFIVLHEETWQLLGALAGVTAGAGLAAWGMWRLRRPGLPAFVLMPEGIFIPVAGVGEFMVPWAEVQGVATGDTRVTADGIPLPMLGKYRNQVLIRMSRAFYDAHIHQDSLYRRGPGWRNVFVPMGDSVCLALNPAYLGADAESLRRAVEARWRMFGARPA